MKSLSTFLQRIAHVIVHDLCLSLCCASASQQAIITRLASHWCLCSLPILETIHLPLQCIELSVTDIPSASNTAAASTASSQCDDSFLNERPANSLHEPSGGPSTSGASSDSPSKHALPGIDPGAALPRTASVNSARSSATPQSASALTHTSALTHNPSAPEGDAASSSRGNSLAQTGSQASSEAETAIPRSLNTQHNPHSNHSSSNSSSSKQDHSGRMPHCHIDWDQVDEGSHDIAGNDATGASNSPLSNQTADEAQQKSYVVLSVSLKTGKVNGGFHCTVNAYTAAAWCPMCRGTNDATRLLGAASAQCLLRIFQADGTLLTHVAACKAFDCC